MENPDTWGNAEFIVDGAIQKYHESVKRGRIGLSEVRMITDALRAAEMLHNEGCRHVFGSCDHPGWEYIWHDAGGWYECTSCEVTVSDEKTFQKIKDSLETPLLAKKFTVPWQKCQRCGDQEKIRGTR